MTCVSRRILHFWRLWEFAYHCRVIVRICTVSFLFCKVRIIKRKIIKLRRRKTLLGREYWIIYRGPDFLASAWFGFSLTPSPPPSPVISSIGDTYMKTRQLVDGREGGRRGAESYDRKEAWSSINHSILSGWREKHKRCALWMTPWKIYGNTVIPNQ